MSQVTDAPSRVIHKSSRRIIQNPGGCCLWVTLNAIRVALLWITLMTSCFLHALILLIPLSFLILRSLVQRQLYFPLDDN